MCPKGSDGSHFVGLRSEQSETADLTISTDALVARHSLTSHIEQRGAIMSCEPSHFSQEGSAEVGEQSGTSNVSRHWHCLMPHDTHHWNCVHHSPTTTHPLYTPHLPLPASRRVRARIWRIRPRHRAHPVSRRGRSARGRSAPPPVGVRPGTVCRKRVCL
jgi:hypothetical protein